MSETSLRIYTYLKTFIEAHSYSPTVREIASGCGLGTTAVVYHLTKLEGEGQIRRERGQARTITLPGGLEQG